MWSRIVLIGLVLAPTIASAEWGSKGVRGGLSVMPLKVQSSEGPAEGVISDPGPTFGAYAVRRFSATVGLVAELQITQKMYTLEMCSPCQDVADIRLWYLEFPVLFRLEVLPGDTKLHFDGGPTFVMGLGGRQRDKMTDSEQVFDDLNPVNFGAMFGIGVEFAAGPGRVTLDARYARWALSVTHATDGEQSDGDVRTSHQVAVLAGYAFP